MLDCIKYGDPNTRSDTEFELTRIPNTGEVEMDGTMRRNSYLFALAFLALGGLVGNLLAMSAQSLVQSVVAALFALFGGSLLVMLEKLSEVNQTKAALGILAISVGTLVGVYSGLYVNEYQLLTPPQSRPSGQEVRKYLRENVTSSAKAIDQQYRNGMLSAKDAYEKLQAVLQVD